MALNPSIRDWRGQVVWLIGASSGIGRATAARLHALGATVIVSARNESALQRFTSQHPGSQALPLDVTDLTDVQTSAAQVVADNGRLDLVLYCVGHYKAMRADAFDLAEMQRHLSINYTGALHVLDSVLPTLIQQGHGHLSLVASVAGYRGLPNALAYGPTKAALQHLAEILYLDLHPLGLGVSVVNPGFVATPLTADNTFDMPALLTPEQAADHIIQAWSKGQFDIHFPKRFTLWLKLMRLLPFSLYFPAIRRTTSS
ncbi:SDR family NAD(P)-dependent oxidoreductase [Hydrogenophaga sp. PAMC20947]|uniref:SDR family NAD(P)-dependent oxidoreductase n=1 Tax=Hydrogenophaga sp. PAMC20947 TaxID=2565558 RepID=UPI00109D8D23|nr:SDR family NAD(P)-dependent oxidoreductase [Hydrogenophaga sp. PAMC20947]QCB47295.1 SDR family NAD(P)-dependent oxidoreductase [Hydrogenophaga sp. PAMC20947]